MWIIDLKEEKRRASPALQRFEVQIFKILFWPDGTILDQMTSPQIPTLSAPLIPFSCPTSFRRSISSTSSTRRPTSTGWPPRAWTSSWRTGTSALRRSACGWASCARPNTAGAVRTGCRDRCRPNWRRAPTCFPKASRTSKSAGRCSPRPTCRRWWSPWMPVSWMPAIFVNT